MKKSIAPARRKQRQRGFSILEILIATVLISLLVASGLYYANIGDKAATVDIAASKAALVVRFPEAVMTVYAQSQTLVGTTAQNLIDTGSVQRGVPLAWTVAGSSNAPTPNTLSVSLTFGTNSAAEAMETYLDNNLDTTMVSEAGVDATNDKVLTVKYEI